MARRRSVTLWNMTLSRDRSILLEADRENTEKILQQLEIVNFYEIGYDAQKMSYEGKMCHLSYDHWHIILHTALPCDAKNLFLEIFPDRSVTIVEARRLQQWLAHIRELNDLNNGSLSHNTTNNIPNNLMKRAKPTTQHANREIQFHRHENIQNTQNTNTDLPSTSKQQIRTNFNLGNTTQRTEVTDRNSPSTSSTQTHRHNNVNTGATLLRRINSQQRRDKQAIKKKNHKHERIDTTYTSPKYKSLIVHSIAKSTTERQALRYIFHNNVDFMAKYFDNIKSFLSYVYTTERHTIHTMLKKHDYRQPNPHFEGLEGPSNATIKEEEDDPDQINGAGSNTQ